MKKINILSRELLASELVQAKSIFISARNAGHTPVIAAGMAYRAGRIAGRDEYRLRLKEAYKRNAALLEELDVMKSSESFKMTLDDLLNNPAPNRTIEEVLNSRTLDEKQEDTTNE